jgi:hypothetical protein
MGCVVNRLHIMLRSLVYAVLALLLCTGALWEADIARPTIIKLHGASAMLSLVVFGVVLGRHVATGWAAKANRASGVALLAALFWLLATGYLLYYAGDETLRALASQTHFWIGLALAAVFALHQGRHASKADR